MGCFRLLGWLAILVPVTAALLGCVQVWMKQKSYVFSAAEVAQIASEALNATEGTRFGGPRKLLVECSTQDFA